MEATATSKPRIATRVPVNVTVGRRRFLDVRYVRRCEVGGSTIVTIVERDGRIRQLFDGEEA